MRAALWLALAGCGAELGLDRAMAPPQASPSMVAEPMADAWGGADEAEEAPPADGDGFGRARRAEGAKGRAGPPAAKQAGAPSPPAPDTGDEARVREWFPEAFLWQPLVETGDDGLARVDVRVPDQLTTWRVLGLAHDRAGQQTGALHTFDSQLPVSVDPAVPGWLFAGDRVVVPSRVEALGAPFAGRVAVEAGGGLEGVGGGSVALSAGGSGLVFADVIARRSGQGSLRAELFGASRIDAAERVVPIHPTGRPITTQRGGVLAGPRSFTAERADATEQRLVVQVFPGPLAVLQSELERVGDAPSGAYAWALMDGVRQLSAASGVEVDEPGLRRLRIRAWQRLVRLARSPSPAQATELLHGLIAPDEPLAQATRDRLVTVVEQGQRGDGTWSDRDRTTLQHVLVQTAYAARALPETSAGARLRAGGALERNRPQIDDPYTAAWALASGVLDPSMRGPLEELVIASLETADDGRRTVRTPTDALDPTGRPPRRAEVLAVTYLALADRDDLDWRGDLVSELLQGWSAERGFGAGHADPLALAAVRQGLATLSGPVRVVLEIDGKDVASGAVDPTQPRVPAVLIADRGGRVTVRSEPAVPGLAFVASHTAWVPFTGTERLPGVEVEVRADPMVVGREGRLRFTIAAPSGASVELVQGLPAGAKVTPGSGGDEAPDVAADRFTVVTRPFGAGEVKELVIPVTPAYAGRMTTRPLEIAVGGQRVHVAPLVWTVSRGEGS